MEEGALDTMRVAILSPRLDCNSPKPLSQAERLAGEGNDVTIFTLEATDVEPQKAKLSILGLPRNLFWARVYMLFFPIDLWKAIRWVPRLRQFDLIIAHHYPMTWLAYLARKFYKVKYTYWYHGIGDPSMYPHLYERVYLRVMTFLTKFTVSNADSAVAVSKFASKELKQLTGLDSQAEYNEIDTGTFHKGIDGKIIRERHKLADAPVIFSLGRVSPQKGFHLLIQAFHIVKSSLPDARLVIGGRPDYGYYSKQLEDMSNDSVVFTGYIPAEDLPYYYAMCNLYANCSVWESFNIPIVEAQACGKPVVAFNIGPHPEVVDENGILVEAGNIEKFAQACIDKLKELRGA